MKTFSMNNTSPSIVQSANGIEAKPNVLLTIESSGENKLFII